MSADKPEDKKKAGTEPKEPGRRKTVRRMLVGGGIISAGSQLPGKWTRPIVSSVVLPAHAQMSITPAPTAAPTNAPPTASPTATPTAQPTASPTAAPTFGPIP